ncbi:MAG: alpha/beta hydrolase [Candidatus Dadabacteria bacterium]
MTNENLSHTNIQQRVIVSKHLGRNVIIDVYFPIGIADLTTLSLLLINDGQNLNQMAFASIYNSLLSSNQVTPVVCVGIHAGDTRLEEYGIISTQDFAGRGAKAKNYELFIIEELLPFLHLQWRIEKYQKIAFCGFSLGGLSALDMVWNHPDIFSIAGVFSGSLWWRSRDVDEDYRDDLHRIMHLQVRSGSYRPGLRFYFTTGGLDETSDRNHNGIIDSIDDTLDLIGELKKLGYFEGYEIRYINYPEGRHDIESWGKALPGFMLWAFGIAG